MMPASQILMDANSLGTGRLHHLGSSLIELQVNRLVQYLGPTWVSKYPGTYLIKGSGIR